MRLVTVSFLACRGPAALLWIALRFVPSLRAVGIMFVGTRIALRRSSPSELFGSCLWLLEFIFLNSHRVGIAVELLSMLSLLVGELQSCAAGRSGPHLFFMSSSLKVT